MKMYNINMIHPAQHFGAAEENPTLLNTRLNPKRIIKTRIKFN